MVDPPLVAVMSAIRVLMTRAREAEACITLIAAHASFADRTVVGIWPSVSLDRELSRKLRTVWSFAN
jgi:hypothetical protein